MGLAVQSISGQKSKTNLAKFEPPNGKCLVFVGQDLGATGGLDNYSNGYSDFFDTPSGVTVYTNLSPGDESFGYFNKGLDGLKTMANWGAGDSWAQNYIDDTTYAHSLMAIGLSMVNHEKKVAKGEHDDLIKELGSWIKSTGRPIFLRIGYEFDGWDWNHYKRKHYLNAWKRIHAIFEAMEVNNVALVWQSKGTGSDQAVLEDWYPGDAIVDWCGYSYFGNPDEEMITFARKHGKPVFIAEASPVLQTDNVYFDSDLKKEAVAKRAWQNWFVPFFRTLNEHQDVIKAFSYINVNWSIQPMWITNPVFQKVDSRIQVSDFISEKWKAEMAKARYLKPTTDLWSRLENK
ncbi:1,4-beta-xylanase [Flagellimonas allohymeniacidonis]|uniref:1,4-beta-xylanase n=1 Tax=Flagellimonas allohymeniacidonis TaxID=2517819 RepID=A0A4Q8QH15_9FLAO|nr:1,4-beta-xylanase [Allomuricauda hymeniacidonis]